MDHIEQEEFTGFNTFNKQQFQKTLIIEEQKLKLLLDKSDQILKE